MCDSSRPVHSTCPSHNPRAAHMNNAGVQTGTAVGSLVSNTGTLARHSQVDRGVLTATKMELCSRMVCIPMPVLERRRQSSTTLEHNRRGANTSIVVDSRDTRAGSAQCNSCPCRRIHRQLRHSWLPKHMSRRSNSRSYRSTRQNHSRRGAGKSAPHLEPARLRPPTEDRAAVS